MKWILFILGLCLILSGCSKKEDSSMALEAPTNAPQIAGQNDDVTNTNAEGLSDGKVCEGFNCPCGETSCATGSTCRDGVCYCGEQATHLNGKFYLCIEGEMKCIGYGGFALCECGPRECSQGTICIESEGNCLCNGEPAPKYAKMDIASWVCERGQWICASGTKNRGNGCECEGTQCIWGSTCEKGKCKCGQLTVFDDPEQYACENGKIICDKPDGCDCGQAKCKQGEQCNDGTCVL